MKTRIPTLLAAAASGLLIASTAQSAAIIGINHQGFNGSDPDLEATDLAGVIPSDHWNNINATNFNFTNLVQDNDGASSTADFTTTTTDVTGGTTVRNNLGGLTPANPNQEMLEGFNQFNSTDETRATGLGFTVSSLESAFTSGGYDLYVYYGNTNPSRTGKVSLYLGTSTTLHAASPTFRMINDTNQFTGTFVNAADVDSSTTVSHYTKLQVRPGDDTDISQFKLTVTGAWTGISGIQIVAVPEPSAAILLGFGGLALVALVARRRR